MKQKIIDYSLELFCACVIVLTLVRILFFPVLPLVRSLVCGYALIAVLHEFEEKRVPGGFYEMVRDILDVRVKPGQEGLSASFVMVYWIVVLSLSFVFDDVIVLFVMLIALGVLEIVGHTAVIFVGRLGRPYSPGLVSAWLMGAMAAYSIVQINAAGLATGADYALGTVLMLAGFAVMQRATLSTTNLTYREFLGNVRGMVLGRLRKGQDGPEMRE